jgi:hypothetical protein
VAAVVRSVPKPVPWALRRFNVRLSERLGSVVLVKTAGSLVAIHSAARIFVEPQIGARALAVRGPHRGRLRFNLLGLREAGPPVCARIRPATAAVRRRPVGSGVGRPMLVKVDGAALTAIGGVPQRPGIAARAPIVGRRRRSFIILGSREGGSAACAGRSACLAVVRRRPARPGESVTILAIIGIVRALRRRCDFRSLVRLEFGRFRCAALLQIRLATRDGILKVVQETLAFTDGDRRLLQQHLPLERKARGLVDDLPYLGRVV